MAPVPPRLPAEVRARGRAGWWAWGFLAFFLLLVASVAYHLLQPTPLARCLDPDRSLLVARAGDAAEAVIVVRRVPRDGQVSARVEPPAVPGGPMRVIVEWDPRAVRSDSGGEHERTLRVLLPRVTEVDVLDRRGPVEERLHLVLRPDGG